jgi:hypothetical protein
LIVLTDITSPTGTVVINGGDPFTTNANVTLTLAATDNSGSVAAMRFSNNGGGNWSSWEDYATSKAWMLLPGNGSKTVFAQFRDAAGNVSPDASDTILLDTNPPPVVRFATTNISEAAGNALIQVVLDRPFNREILVDYFTSDGTARAGEDYTGVNGTLTFPANNTFQTFSLPILQNSRVAPDKTILLNFGYVSNAVAGPQGILIIIDDDFPMIFLASTNFNASESDGSGVITVRLSAATSKEVSIRYEAANGTAIAGSDFIATNGLINFAPGQTNAAFTVAILNDSVNEVHETLLLTLTNAINAFLVSPSNATLTILDDDLPTVFFSSDRYEISETGGVATINVWLNKSFPEDVFVDYTVLGGTATAGVDYQPVNNTLHFFAGQTNKLFFVPVFNNALAGPAKTVQLTLSNFMGATAGVPSEATLYILDDDGPPRFFNPRLTTNGLFQTTLTGLGGQRFSIEVSFALTNWTTLATLTNAAGTMDFTDPAPTSGLRRFYRTVLAP